MANPMAFMDGGEEFELMRVALGLSDGAKKRVTFKISGVLTVSFSAN